MITAAWGKTGTEVTPDYASIDPVWSNKFEGVWHMEGISSNILNDSSGNGVHLTTTGGPVETSGQNGRGILLDGTDDHLEAMGYKGILGNAERTMETWIKTSAVDKAIMSCGDKTTSMKNGPSDRVA